MNISLTPELEKLVNDKVQSGLYNSASEVVREGLRLLRDHDELRRIRQEELRKEVRRGAEQIRNGQYLEFGSAEQLTDSVINSGMEKLKTK